MERSQSRDAAPACQKDPAEVVLAPPGQAQLGGDPKVDPEPSGEIIYLIWPGRAEDGWMDGCENTNAFNKILSIFTSS